MDNTDFILPGSGTKKYKTDKWVKTGETWIDGKPIYRRCFTGDTIASTPPGAIPDTSSVEKIINHGGFADSSGAIIPFPYSSLYTYDSVGIFLSPGAGIVPRVVVGNKLVSSHYEIWVDATLSN